MTKTKNLILLGLLFLYDFALFAQPGDDDEEGDLEGDDPLPGAPINSKLIYLMIIGIAFAWYTYKRNKKSLA